jgi:hypothetical protein
MVRKTKRMRKMTTIKEIKKENEDVRDGKKKDVDEI